MLQDILSSFRNYLLMTQMLWRRISGWVHGTTFTWNKLTLFLGYIDNYSQGYIIIFLWMPIINPDNKPNHYHIIPCIKSGLTLEDKFFSVIPGESFTSLFSYYINLVFCCFYNCFCMCCFFRIILFELRTTKALLLHSIHGNVAVKTETNDQKS